MTAEELQKILDSHRKWLNDEAGGEKADLRKSDLRHSGLSYSDLRKSDLSDSVLSGSDLSYSDLREADFRGAVLRGADFRGANLHGANFLGAILHGADLRHCIGNGREIQTIQSNWWTIVLGPKDMAIGCQQHSFEDWMAFNDDKIARMDREALGWWKIWKPILQQILETRNDR